MFNIRLTPWKDGGPRGDRSQRSTGTSNAPTSPAPTEVIRVPPQPTAKMSMPDRGDSYRLEYLGSVMLSHASTGLGMLQKPLKELYFRYRQPGGNKRAQERHLVMTGRGMTMTYRDNPAMPPMELFYDMPDIVFWDAVQFVTVKGHDKKYRGAFEPLDNDHSRNKDNLFSHLEKKYNFLIQMKHPALFTCALRRTMGVKAIDVHAFVCSSDEEALSIMRALDTLQYYYNTDAEQGSGVFEYKPFIQNRTPMGSLRSQTGLQASTPDLRFTPQAHPVTSEITSAFPAPIATPDRPARPPRDTIREPPNPNRPQVYRLTQEDFSSSQPNLSPGSILFDPGREEEDANLSLRRRYNPPEPAMSNDNTYEYIRHIEQEKPVSAQPVRNPSSVYTTTLATRGQQSPNSPDPRSYDSMTRDMYIGDSTIQSRGNQYSRDYHVNTNQGPTHYMGHGQQDQNNTYDTRLPHAQAGGNHGHQSRDKPFRSNGPMHSPTSPASPPPEPPPKPVAKVQPRKIQGVKVLPNMPISPVKEHAHSSSGESSARSSVLYEDGDSRRNSALSAGGSDSSSHHRSEYYDNTGAWSSQQQKGSQIANWQFNRGVDSGRQSGTIRPPPEEERYRTTEQEKVQRSRKDAEIASVFQNVQIEDRTWKPSRMSDFQQGLGYLP